MKNLKDIFKAIDVRKSHGSMDVSIESIRFDSRQVEQGDVFVALKGTQADGHRFIDSVVAAGAFAIVVSELDEGRIHALKDSNSELVIIEVEDTATVLSKIASAYFGNPSEELKLIGVTGTNGKTTICTQLHTLTTMLGYSAGLLSTVKVIVGRQVYPATHTTPDPLQINAFMRQMVDQGVEYCFMEVSSHGIDQGRVEGLDFDIGVFTNLTHDHLDYHETFAEYRNVKKRFFDGLKPDAYALSNLDDKNGVYMLQNTRAQKRFYAMKSPADYQARILENNLDGMTLVLNKHEFISQMLGSFNAYNLAAIFGVSNILSFPEDRVFLGLSLLKGAEGRFQSKASKTGIYTVVDYAHTPDAVQNVLENIKEFKGKGKVITVIGCGGNRDRDKRPKMANIAALYSDQAILTSDNPRFEEPQAIINDMETGLKDGLAAKSISVIDRRQAIKLALQMAKPGDIVLVAGKGHENYQEVKGERVFFDDQVVIDEELTQLKK